MNESSSIPPTGPQSKTGFSRAGFIRELLAGLTVSFVAISLGAAFGVASGRGALAGILSAGVIALITAALGGTRIQCSGPTAPMTAVTIVMITAIGNGLLREHPDTPPDQFINMVLVVTGLMLIVAAVCRLGRFIKLVPVVVISGFMNGIAVLIWVSSCKKLFGLGGMPLLEGPMAANLLIALATLLLCFMLPPLLREINARLASFIPATLAAIVLVTGVVYLLGADVERVKINEKLSSFADVSRMVSTNVPTHWSPGLLWLAFPFAGQLAMLAYLDTLLTSLVVDKKAQDLFRTKEATAQNRELAAQGIANAAVATFGGIPGAQATIRSVLILNEGARMRMAGVMVGAFVLVEMVLFQDLITMIPKAVFSGVLIKVGFDVFDWRPLQLYIAEIRQGRVPDDRRPTDTPMVTHLNMFFIAGTTLTTVLVNLNVAVIAFGILFYVVRAIRPVHDLVEGTETDSLTNEP